MVAWNRNSFIALGERELMLPHALTKPSLNHSPSKDVTEGYTWG